MADPQENEKAHGRPGVGRGESAFPKIRFVALLGNGTHVLWASPMGAFATDELTLVCNVAPALGQGISAWPTASSPAPISDTGRPKPGRVCCGGFAGKLVCMSSSGCPDGSYLSRIYASTSDRRHRRNWIVVQVIDSRLDKVPGAGPLSRLMTAILGPGQAPARELAATDHERGQIETALEEWKTRWRGAEIGLRTRRPEWGEPKLRGLRMAHFAISGLLHEAALKADEDPGRLPFLPAVRVLERRPVRCAAIPPSAEESPA